ncbi:type IV pilin protein [Massilia niabensis]|uniref:Type IV pilin protein n=1 Tax=Massilia niabensis TaxID=544910 RepID=A0ABW0L7Y8_9BURK
MPRSLTMRRPGAAGFTLIELMITVAIIVILASVAYPSYTAYLVRSNRAAAQVYLMEAAQKQSQIMADSRSYATTVADLGLTPPAAVSSRYTIAIAVAEGPPSSFTITAAPILTGPQRRDGDLTINSAGTRTPAAKW